MFTSAETSKHFPGSVKTKASVDFHAKLVCDICSKEPTAETSKQFPGSVKTKASVDLSQTCLWYF